MVRFHSGKAYIGQTVQRVEERLKDHTKASSSCHAFKAALAKHGVSDVSILCTVPESQLNAEEVRLIAVHNTLAPNGYNLLPGGDQLRDAASQELMRKARMASEAFQEARREVQARPSTTLARRQTTADTRRTKVQSADAMEAEQVELKAYKDALRNARQAEAKLPVGSSRDPVAEVKAFYGEGMEARKAEYHAKAKAEAAHVVSVFRRDHAKMKRWQRIESMSPYKATKLMKQARWNALHVARLRTPDKEADVQERWKEEWIEFEAWLLTQAPLASSISL